MEHVASQWKLILLVTAAALVSLSVAEPDYNKLQMAKDANDFRMILGDHDGRALVANVSDMIFTAGYGSLGVIAFRRLATRVVALIGMLLSVGTALLDETENVLLLLNIRRFESVTDGWINAMTTIGVVKWSFAAAAVLLLIVVAIRARTSRKV